MNQLKPPEFPKEFVLNHCPKVLEARHWRKVYRSEGTDQDDADYAECAFHSAGFGKECESCNLFLTRPYLGTNSLDERFLPAIEEYYDKLDAYERQVSERDAALQLLEMSFGEGI